MTQAEYNSLYAQARATYSELSLATYSRIEAAYASALDDIVQILKDLDAAGASSLTVSGYQQLELQLKQSASAIQQAIATETEALMTAGLNVGSDINIQYMDDVISNVTGLPFTVEQLQSAYIAANNAAMISTISRVFQSGYNFAESVIGVGQAFQDAVKEILIQGQALLKNTREIAKELQSQIVDGQLWKALRIARSELYMSLQDAAVYQGQMNPAATGMYEWILESTRQHWNCACPDIAKNSPYEYNAVPGYPHPNCRCYVRPLLRSKIEFENDLKRWANGEVVPYIDQWYNGVYKTYAA